MPPASKRRPQQPDSRFGGPRVGVYPLQMAVQSDRRRTGAATDVPYRVLVVANETVEGRALLEEIQRQTHGRPTVVHVVAPALIASRVKFGLGDVDEARVAARGRLERTLEEIRRMGLDATGEIGDADPELALQDVLAKFPADEVIISTHPPERSVWLEKGLVERARHDIDLPITHVVVDLDEERGRPEVTAVEHVPPRPRREGDDEEQVDYLPPMAMRDRLTLVVGIVGTISLGILALLCPANGDVSGGCAARILIAIGAFMITVWHVVALIIMGAIRYRGFWQDVAADLVLYGIPPAIVVSALLH
jgi:hypothetical protein